LKISRHFVKPPGKSSVGIHITVSISPQSQHTFPGCSKRMKESAAPNRYPIIMNRRRLLLTAPAAVLGASATFSTGRAQSTAAPRATTSPPCLFAPSSSGISVCWGVSHLSLGRVDITGAGKTQSFPVPPLTGFTAHGEHAVRVRLRGLKPGVAYRYRTVTTPLEGPLKGQDFTGEEQSFRLPDPAAAATTFAVWNDTHDHHDTLRALHSMTAERHSDFLLWNGDFSNNVNREDQITPLYLAPAGGLPVAANTPLYFVRGNHDVRGLRAPRIADYLDTPGGRPYYAFRSGPLAAIVLDTGEDKYDHHPSFLGLAAFDALRREQAVWLRTVITRKEMQAPHRVVFCHLPLRWKDESQVAEKSPESWDFVSLRSRRLWHDSLVRWNTSLVISGHIHAHHYFPADDQFPYPQLIGGGPRRNQAILITGRADADQLDIRLLDLDNNEVRRVTCRART
jgi:hypothetical protein